MSCCGQGRMALKASQSGVAPMGSGQAQLAGGPMVRATTPMRYLGTSPIVVRGAISGGAYPFSPARPVQMVDARDVAGLLKRGMFRRGT